MKAMLSLLMFAALAAPVRADSSKLDPPDTKKSVLPQQQTGNAFEQAQKAAAEGTAASQGTTPEETKKKAGEAVEKGAGSGNITIPQSTSKSTSTAKGSAYDFNKMPTKPTATVVPPHGKDPGEKAPNTDPNRWNSTIAGAKMAIYGALLGFIFFGPAGAMLFGMVGFGAGYYIKKMNDS